MDALEKRIRAEQALKKAAEQRAQLVALKHEALDKIAFFQAELLKANRQLERAETLIPDAEFHVRETFDFYRQVILGDSQSGNRAPTPVG